MSETIGDLKKLISENSRSGIVAIQGHDFLVSYLDYLIQYFESLGYTNRDNVIISPEGVVYVSPVL